MLKYMMLCAVAAMAAMMSGCCGGPIGFANGPGSHCGNCDGGVTSAPIGNGRIGALAAAHKRSVCGNGCGEVYYGEWLSNPPDCCDPCDNEQQCTPPVVAQYGFLPRLFMGFCGTRNSGGGGCCEESCGDCCDSCGDGEVIHHGEVYSSGGAGCSSCASHSQGNIPFASKPVQRAPYTRGGVTTTASRARTVRR